MRRRDFIALAGVATAWPRAVPAQQKTVEQPMIPKAWLTERTTVEESEAANPGITDERTERFPDAAKPFGFQHREWEEFKALILPGDELWVFSSPPESWKNLAGSFGVALVRGGVPIKILVTVVN
jgi:hypothetical protein